MTYTEEQMLQFAKEQRDICEAAVSDCGNISAAKIAALNAPAPSLPPSDEEQGKEIEAKFFETISNQEMNLQGAADQLADKDKEIERLKAENKMLLDFWDLFFNNPDEWRERFKKAHTSVKDFLQLPELRTPTNQAEPGNKWVKESEPPKNVPDGDDCVCSYTMQKVEVPRQRDLPLVTFERVKSDHRESEVREEDIERMAAEAFPLEDTTNPESLSHYEAMLENNHFQELRRQGYKSAIESINNKKD